MRWRREPRRWPRWLRAVLGLACAIVGTVIVFRPFASLSVLVVAASAAAFATGAATLVSPERATRGRSTWLAGLGWILAGLLLLVWPDLTTRGFAIVVGVAMIVGGLADLIGGLRGTTDERLEAVIGGLASLIFGALALAWPDLTLLVVAVIFGARTILFGLRTLFAAIRDRDGLPRAVTRPGPPGRLRRWAHVLGAIVALVLALALAGVSVALNAGEPVVDDFYAAPGDVPPQPGVLLRVEPYTAGIPSDAEAWRILYTTTRNEGVPAVASAIVAAPRGPSDDPRPVIAWAHGTTGIDESCAPSVLGDLGAGALYSLDRVIEEGWVLVATDYIGLGTEGPHPYLIGQGEGRSVLDAVRAARQVEDLSLAEQTVVWGHSQGGGAALWTGMIAPAYAPDAYVIGIAALAPASDLVGLMQNLGTVRGGSVFATFVLSAYADAYADVSVDDYVRASARVAFDETVERCLAEPSALASIASSLATGMSSFSEDLASGAIATRLQENVPIGPIEAPVLIAQGEADSIVLPEVQAAFVQRLCDSGQPVDFRTYPGLGHVPLVEADSSLIPELISWTQDRFDGIPAGSTCPTA